MNSVIMIMPVHCNILVFIDFTNLRAFKNVKGILEKFENSNSSDF